MNSIISDNNEYKIFFNMIEEVEEFVPSQKDGTFLICSPELGVVLQDSSHYFITTLPHFTGSRVWKTGRFMGMDLYIDSFMEGDDYRLIHRYGNGNAREIIIDKLLNKVTCERILDLSHYKTIIK